MPAKTSSATHGDRPPRKPRIWNVAIPEKVPFYMRRDQDESWEDNSMLMNHTLRFTKERSVGAAGALVITSMGYAQGYATQIPGPGPVKISTQGFSVHSGMAAHTELEARYLLEYGISHIVQLPFFNTRYGKVTRFRVAWAVLVQALRLLFAKTPR